MFEKKRAQNLATRKDICLHICYLNEITLETLFTFISTTNQNL